MADWCESEFFAFQEENISENRALRGIEQYQEVGENYIKRNSIICAVHRIYLKEDGVGRTCSTHGKTAHKILT
jgi:hypothetical protein